MIKAYEPVTEVDPLRAAFKKSTIVESVAKFAVALPLASDVFV